MAIAAHARATIAAIKVALRGPIDIIGNYQVQFAVVVVIEPSPTRGPPSGIPHSCRRGNIGEGSVSVVVVENASSVAEYEQIGESVVIVVSYGYAHSEQTFGAYPRGGGDIGESAITVVAVERASQRLLGTVHAGCCAIYQVKIKQAVLVVIDPAAACTHGFDQVFLRGCSIVVMKSDASLNGNVEKRDGTRSDRGPAAALCGERDTQRSEALQHVAAGNSQERFHKRAQELRNAPTTLILGDSPFEQPELTPLRIFLNKHGSRRTDLAGFVELRGRLYF